MSGRIGTLARRAAFGAAVIAAFAGCGEGILAAKPATDVFGSLTGELGGLPVASRATATLSQQGPGDGRMLFIWSTRPGQGTQFDTQIAVHWHGVGTYALDSLRVVEWETVGGDVLTGARYGSRPAPGELVITSFDEATNTMRGTVRFSLSRWSAALGWHETVEFTDGEFEVPVRVPDLE